jgi:hypothetical protein
MWEVPEFLFRFFSGQKCPVCYARYARPQRPKARESWPNTASCPHFRRRRVALQVGFVFLMDVPYILPTPSGAAQLRAAGNSNCCCWWRCTVYILPNLQYTSDRHITTVITEPHMAGRVITPEHRLNTGLDLRGLFGLRCTAVLIG